MRNLTAFLLSLLLFSQSSFAQVHENRLIDNIDLGFGIVGDFVSFREMCSLTDASLDEYKQVRCGIKVDGGYGYRHDGENSWSAEIDPEFFQQVTDNIVFQSATLDVYKFNQCQKEYFDSLPPNSQPLRDLSRASFQMFSQVKNQIKSLDDSIAERMEQTNSELRVNVMSTKPTSDFRIKNTLERSASENDPRRAQIAEFASTLPLGNRPQMQAYILEASKGNYDEETFVQGYESVVRDLSREAQTNYQHIASNVRSRDRNGTPVFEVSNSMKKSLFENGIIENLLIENNMEEFVESDYMCRYASQQRGQEYRLFTELALAGASLGFTGYAVAALRVGARLSRVVGARAGLSGAGNAISQSAAVRAASGVSTRMGQAFRSSKVGKYALTGTYVTTDFGLTALEAKRECITPEYVASKAAGACNAESQYDIVIAEAKATTCYLGLGVSALTGLSMVKAFKNMGRATPSTTSGALDEFAEVNSTPIVVSGGAVRRDFAIDNDSLRRIEAELAAKNIDPSATEFTAEQLAGLTPEQRAVLFENIADTALDSRALRRFNELADDGASLTISSRRNRLRDILKDNEPRLTRADLDLRVSRIESSGILGRRAPAATSPSATARLENRSNSAAPVARTNNINEPEFISRYQARTPTNIEQNRAFIAAARAENTPGRFFIDTQNQRLKQLNDSLDNKPLVDALSNRHSEMVQEAIEKFSRDNPDINLNILPYSDYKGMRFAIDGPPGREAELMGQLRTILDDVDSKFMNELNDDGLISIGESVRSEQWFSTGISKTADEANVQARFPPGSSWQQIERTWSDLNSTRRSIESRFGSTPLMRSVGESESKIPTAEVFDLLRKKDNPAEIARVLNRRHSLDPALTQNDVGQLQQYFRQVDLFSPGLLLDRRVTHNFEDATHGGITIDFAGVGSRNAEATAEGLARGLNLNQAIARTRRAEVGVTRSLDELKESSEAAVTEVLRRHNIEVRVTVSGDDMVAIPSAPLTPAIREEIVLAQSRAGVPSDMRISFFREGVDNSTNRAIIAAEGETIEKALRARLEGQLPPDELRQLTIAADMRGVQSGSGEVGLITNNNLSPESMGIVRREFDQLVGPRAATHTPARARAAASIPERTAEVTQLETTLLGNANVRFFRNGEELSETAGALTPGKSYVVVVRDNKLIIGEDYVGSRGTTRGSHLSILQDVDGVRLDSEEAFEAMRDTYKNQGGAIRVNADGSIDVSGYHLQMNSRKAAKLIRRLILEASPDTVVRKTSGRLPDPI